MEDEEKAFGEVSLHEGESAETCKQEMWHIREPNAACPWRTVCRESRRAEEKRAKSLWTLYTTSSVWDSIQLHLVEKLKIIE